ncbi:hypothetical protein CDAR_77891 [Caerostris darwini]|uniref:Uncharacterized protein n=1 Tax=Caerostris darwini TaxID=1538125 RepID=A0AAV4NCH1_9ARAC|nr:hypothetical protein CDAR_77891 [Caerostris darwini]
MGRYMPVKRPPPVGSLSSGWGGGHRQSALPAITCRARFPCHAKTRESRSAKGVFLTAGFLYFKVKKSIHCHDRFMCKGDRVLAICHKICEDIYSN